MVVRSSNYTTDRLRYTVNDLTQVVHTTNFRLNLGRDLAVRLAVSSFAVPNIVEETIVSMSGMKAAPAVPGEPVTLVEDRCGRC